ncbi:MAG: putative GH43/DUF377 family glycosyl hydrolase [Verrucomicrobiales bacterium]|jgi:predicted GH43/DUF377 family glycosyl hydrolase
MNASSIRSILWIILLALLPGSACAESHPFVARPQPWQRLAEPIISANSTEQTWNKVVTYSPTVIHHDGLFRMWYLGTSTKTRLSNTVMGYAESEDGIEWREHSSNPILTAADIPWGQVIQTPHVLFDAEESIYKMWFVSGYPRTIDERGRVTELDQHLGYATSPDGLQWNVHPQPIYESGRSPSVIKEGPGNYRMWMGSLPASDSEFKGLYSNIFEFSSPDGISWKRAAKPAIYPGGKITTAIYPFVYKEKNTYYMWYGGHIEGRMFQLYGATSEDGSTWESDQERSAFPAREGKTAFDSRYTSTPCLVATPDRYLLYYSARDWVIDYVDGNGVKHRDGASPYAHIGVAVIPRPPHPLRTPPTSRR